MAICQPKYCFGFVSIGQGLLCWSLFDLVILLATWITVFQFLESSTNDLVSLSLITLFTCNILTNLCLMVGLVRRMRYLLGLWQCFTIVSFLGLGAFVLHLYLKVETISVFILLSLPADLHRSTVA